MVKTLTNALTIIDVLSNSQAPLGLDEIARKVALNKSSVYRLLFTLKEFGYVSQNPATEQYRLTLKLWQVGVKVLGHRDLKSAARPVMEDLARRTEETIHLSVLDGTDAVYIDKVDGSMTLRIHTPVGGREPAHCSSTGKALIAFADEAVVKLILESKLAAPTVNTIVNAQALQRELADVRARGYATNLEEWRIGVCGVAAPLRDHDGVVVASIGVSGPSERLPKQRLRELAPVLLEAAANISAEIGGANPEAKKVPIKKAPIKKRLPAKQVRVA